MCNSTFFSFFEYQKPRSQKRLMAHCSFCFLHLKLIRFIITGLPVWQSQSESGWDLFVLFILFLLLFFFSVLVKVLPVTPLVSGVFVHRAFCEYFLRIERVVEMRRFLWWTQ